jgi:hypothetical protein
MNKVKVQPKEYVIAKLKRDITKIWNQFYDALYKDKDNMRATYLRAVATSFQEVLNRLLDVELKPLSEYGELFTKEEFLQAIDDGLFVSDDGSGYYAFKDSQSNIEIIIPMLHCGFFDNRFTHVMWFNK